MSAAPTQVSTDIATIVERAIRAYCRKSPGFPDMSLTAMAQDIVDALSVAQGAGDCGTRNAAKHLQEQLDLSVLESQRLLKGLATINNYLCENPPRVGDATFNCEALLASVEPWPDALAQPTQGGDTQCQNCTPENCAYIAGGYGKCSSVQGGDKGEAVAWQKIPQFGDPNKRRWTECGGEPNIQDFWREQNYEVRPLYAAPQPASNAPHSPGTEPWTPAGFWEYVGGLTGEFEADQMRDTLAERGLQIVGISDPAYAAKEPADAEAVAKAIYDWQFGAGTWDASQSSMKDHYVGLARAAISSLSSTQERTP